MWWCFLRQINSETLVAGTGRHSHEWEVLVAQSEPDPSNISACQASLQDITYRRASICQFLIKVLKHVRDTQVAVLWTHIWAFMLGFQLMLWVLPAMRGWDICDQTGGYDPRGNLKLKDLKYPCLFVNTMATFVLGCSLFVLYHHKSRSDSSKLMRRSRAVVVTSWLFLSIYTAELEVTWCWPGTEGDDLAALIVPWSVASEALQQVMFAWAVRKRIQFTEQAFAFDEDHVDFGSSGIRYARNTVGFLGIAAALAYFARAIVLCDSGSEGNFIINLSDLVYAIFEAGSCAGSLYTAFTTFRTMSKVMGLASDAAEDGTSYMKAEANWARGVLKRIRVALALPCALAAVGSGINVACTLQVMMAETRHDEELYLNVQTILLIACNGGPVLADLAGLFVIVGLFQPDKSELDVEAAVVQRTQSGAQRRSSSSFDWKTTVHKMTYRSISTEELLDFYSSLGFGEDELVIEYEGPVHSVASTNKLTTMSLTRDVVQWAIIPRTVTPDGGQSYVDMLRGDYGAGANSGPDRMVTHNWENLFVHLVAAVVANALGDSEYAGIAHELEQCNSDSVIELKRRLREKGALHIRYWICAFCVNQHASICDKLGCTCKEKKLRNDSDFDLCEMNKFDDLLAHMHRMLPGIQHLVAADRGLHLMSRVWCVAELVEASKCKIPQHLCAFSIQEVGGLEMYARVVNISVKDCVAFRPEDKDMIMKKIGMDVAFFDSQLQKVIFQSDGRLGLFNQNFEGFGVMEAAVQVSRRTAHANAHRGARRLVVQTG